MNLSEIPGESVHKAIREIIEKVLQSKNYKLTVSSASKEGENNFCGVVYRVSFQKDDESENSSKSSLIVKVAPQNEIRRAQFRSREFFLQEIYVFNQVLAFFSQFEELKGITAENRFIEYPMCYQTIEEEPNECLLLEDLNVRGFSIIDRYTDEVTTDHVHLFMQALGKFHALSFALKDQQPEKFHELASNLKEMFMKADEPQYREYFKSQTKNVLSVLNNNEDAHLLAKMKKFFERDAIDSAADCMNLELIGSASVIAYGDAWQNNSMYRYNDAGKPIEINLLDWQIARHATPIMDIAYFIFCCTTKELRDDHYDDFLNTYHNSLSAHIRRLGSDPATLFPYTLMQEHLQKFGKIGIITASVALPIITAERGKSIDLDEFAEDFAKNENTDAFNSYISDNSREKFNKRMRDVVIDMVRLGYV